MITTPYENRQPNLPEEKDLTEGDTAWLDRELARCEFKDARLGKRLRSLAGNMWKGMGESIPFACQDWANTKAAYRFFSNNRVSEADILGGHFQSTQERFSATDGLVLVLQDTTEFSYQRLRPELIGSTRQVANEKVDEDGRRQLYTVCGLLIHSSLVVTPDGLPLGIAAIKFWTRKKFQGANSLKNRSINPTRIPIEEKESFRWLENLRQSSQLLKAPERCVHIGDRESDIYELFCAAQEVGTHFLVRTCVDRLAGNGFPTVSAAMAGVPVSGCHRIEVRDGSGKVTTADLDIKYHRPQVLPPIGKQNKYPTLTLTVIHAIEHKAPEDRKAIEWKLMTDLPVTSMESAIEKLSWYAMRWKIETFHKILKSGCKAKESRLRTAERLTNVIAIFCILSWRNFWLTMMNRTCPEAAPTLALTSTEIHLLNHLLKDNGKTTASSKNLSHYVTQVAKLGGYLARASDPPPGNIVMWRGLARLTDIALGFRIAAGIVGN